MISLLFGLQLGNTKHHCFLCQWNSRDDKLYYIQKNWPASERFIPGRFNVYHFPLVDSAKICLLQMQMKVDLFKNFVKATDQDGSGFA